MSLLSGVSGVLGVGVSTIAPLVPTPSRVVGLLRRGRRVSTGGGRAHVEVHTDATRSRAFRERLLEVLGDHPDVAEVQWQPEVGRVVVTHEDGWLADAELVRLVRQVEAEVDVGDHWHDDRPDHPSDAEPITRAMLEVGADVVGIGLAAVGGLARLRPVPAQLDLAWLATVVENVPRLRSVVERRLGPHGTDLALGVASSLTSGLVQGTTGPLVDIARRSQELRALTAQRSLWEQREPDLVRLGTSDPHPEVARPVPDRPTPMPPGPIETYADQAWVASLGAFGVSVALTGSLARSAAPLLDGVPKAARLGREGFVSALTVLLAGRGVLVMDRDVLLRLDRVDTLLVPADLLLVHPDEATVGLRAGEPHPHGRDLLAVARGVGLAVVVVGDPGRVEALQVERVVPGTRLGPVVRRLQEEGAVVLAVGRDDTPGLRAADVGVGLVTEGRRPPWGAHLLCGGSLTDVVAVLVASADARRTSRQSVRFALFGAGAGALAALGGLRADTGPRVMRAVNAASLLSVANGVRVGGSLGDRLPRPTPTLLPWHAMPTADVLAELGSSRRGLDADVARERHVAPPREPSDRQLLARAVADELDNPLTPILVAGAGLSVVSGALADAIMVGSVVGLNALVGGVQRFRTDRAVADLGRVHARPVTVRRGGEDVRVEVTALVPGDLVRLGPGEAVPADCRVVEARALQVDESSLTGETGVVTKSAAPSDAPTVADRRSMLYAGTSVAAGTALGVVVAVGEDTEARRALVHLGSEPPETGVEARLHSLTRLTAPVAVAGGAALTATGLARGRALLDVLGAGVSLAVAAVPEGLPLLATVAQLGAARRLADHGVLVRNPRAVEALGRVEVLCADKTGTLTEGRIRLALVSDGVSDVQQGELAPSHRAVLLAARRATPIRHGQELHHPTDHAIATGTRAWGVERQEGGGFALVDEIPFEPSRGYHAVLADTGDGRLCTVKGAPEVLVGRCATWAHPEGVRDLDVGAAQRLEAVAEQLAARGLRVLAVAHRPLPDRDALADDDVAGLVLDGFVGLADPARPTSRAAVDDLRGAGVQTVMVTGDHPATARAIGEELGLLDGHQRVLTGTELDAIDDDTLDELLPDVAVFARTSPAQKVRIVRAHQRAGHVVAVTGDGANDAPAIRLAEVGIALGEHATEAARDAADLVITDERIDAIVDAMAEGRGLWSSVRDAVAVLVGGNLGEIGFTVLGALVEGRPPIAARQLLVVNLLTDVAPAMAIALRAPTAHDLEALLAEGPEASLGERLDRAIAWRALGTVTGAAGAHLSGRLTGRPARARTMGLVALVGAQLGQTLAAGSSDPRIVLATAASAGALVALVQTPGVSQLFGSTPLGPVGWATAAGWATIGAGIGVLGPHWRTGDELAGRLLAPLTGNGAASTAHAVPEVEPATVE